MKTYQNWGKSANRLIWLLVISAIAACDRPVSENAAWRLEKVHEISLQSENDEVVGDVSDIAIDAEGSFYLADKSNHTVWVVDRQGHLLRRIGSKGQGPGELQQPVSVSIRGDTLAVLEAGNKRVTLVSRRGKHIDYFAVAGPTLSSVELSEQDTMLIVGESLGIEHFIYYATSGRRLSGRNPVTRTAVMIPIVLPGGHLSLAPDNTILYSSLKKYEVLRLNWHGDTLQVYTAAPPGYIAPDMHSRENFVRQREWSIVGLPLQVNEMVLVQRLHRKSAANQTNGATYEYWLDLFTKSGESIQHSIPAPGSFLLVKDDLLYAIDTAPIEHEAGNPAIAVYRLVQ